MEVSGQLDALTPVPIGQEAGWAPESVWALWSKQKPLALDGDLIPAVQPVAHRHTEWAIPAQINALSPTE
jgi:hypothetical protein